MVREAACPRHQNHEPGLMLKKLFVSNKHRYLAYNHFRKNIFTELAPKDGEAILYLLPWMLSVNDPGVPGYVSNLHKSIAVYGAATDEALIKREPVFKKIFNIRKTGPLLKPTLRVSLIQGLYTIGSAGTISQTCSSDCDIWICIDKTDFDETAKGHLLQKINLIKDWMDANLKMPVFFFLCDIGDIRNSHFGVVGDESSGSAQHNVLKEEFYRTSILISGKIPLWWVCFHTSEHIDYQSFASQYGNDVFDDYDFLDLGSLESVDNDESFGAALWQFNKALTHPLKSVIKMLLLEMFLVSDKEALLCHHFRNAILSQKQDSIFQDPSLFTLNAILEYNQSVHPDTLEFIKQCSYLRYDVKLNGKKRTLKETLAKEIFDLYPFTREQIDRMNRFSRWPLLEQLEFGEKIFLLLLHIYKRIMNYQKDVVSKISKKDMTIIGRKLAACLEKKDCKIPLVHKPIASLNPPNLTFVNHMKLWQVFAVGKSSKPLIANADIVYCIAYLVWNDVYQSSDVRMTPNPTPVTLQEINNLAKHIKDIFGVFDITSIDFDHFLETEKITKMLVIVSFENPGQAKEMNDFCVIYRNHWGELFFRRFHSPDKFKKFIDQGGISFLRTEVFYYIQRNSLYYEKIIERTKSIVTHVFSGVAPFR
jgi:adenylate cyclase class 1